MNRPGCCGNCDGEGSDASAPETGGLCWDCQGTGHPHIGPCGFWGWWKRRSAILLMVIFGWMVAGSVPVYLVDREWIVWIYFAGVPASFAWLALDAIFHCLEHAKVWN